MASDEKSRVLVVDDDEAVGKVLAALIGQAGYAVTLVLRGEAALAELERRPFELVLTDVRMPGLGGLELLKAVSERWPEVPVVLLSAHGTVAMAVEAMKLGATDFLQKPFDREEILFVVQKALAGSREAQQRPPQAKGGQAALEALLGTSPEL
jgi:two-component system response regulator AtoC